MAKSKSAAKKVSPKKAPANKQSQNENDPTAPELDAAMLKQISDVRSKVHETFGHVALTMTALPRYKNLSISDLGPLLLEPLIRDRVAIASQKPSEDEKQGLNQSGVAIWASVSEEVDAKIREQVKAGVFPVRMRPEDWVSGDINWLFDVIAPNQKMATSVIANFKQVVGENDVRFHPLVTRLIDPEVLKKMGATPIKGEEKADVAKQTEKKE